MSSRFEISSVNKGLFNKSILQKYITSEHKKTAEKISIYFKKEKNKNPYELSVKQLNALSEDDTIDYYVKPILECLGFKYRKKLKDSNSRFPDIWLFSDDPEETDSDYLQRHNLTVLEAKRYSVDLDVGDSRKETPPEQISQYVTTNMRYNPKKIWGILSNGYKWRLYSPTHGNDKYIEFDIDHALENKEELELFCLIFSPNAFKISKNREDFLSLLHTASLDSWVSITDEIKVRGNDVLLNLVSGFFEEIKDLARAKEMAYNTLFRLLYTLYIESKHLIPKGSVPYNDLSLRVLLHDIYETTIDEYDISNRLNSLFEVYFKGKGILPPKFGGEHFESVINIKVKNKWVRPALELLTVFSAEKSSVKFFDYSSLNVELIGNIYEGTLGLIFKTKNGKIEIEKIKKKTGTTVHSTGTTYTPPDVVKYLIGETLPKKFKKLPTICDPSCGSGHFLVQALRHLSSCIDYRRTKSPTLQMHKRRLALECIFGTDINMLATKLTRLMLVIETSEKGQAAADFRNNIKSFNSLTTKWNKSNQWLANFKSKRLLKEKGFTYVIGNPPYVRADEPGELENRKKILDSKQYKYLYKKWDLFIPFIELAVGLTKSTKGSIAYVVSNGITYAPYAQKCTEDLSASRAVKFVSHFSMPFPNWVFPATCFVVDFSKKNQKAERRVHFENDTSKILSSEMTENAFTDANKEEVQNNLKNWKGLSLGDLCYVSVGMVLNSHEKLAKTGVKFKKEDLIVFSKNSTKSHQLPYVDNEDIGFGVLNYINKHIEYGEGCRAPEKIRRPTFPELHTDFRILLSRSKKGNSAAIVDLDLIVSDNTIILKRWENLIGVNNRAIAVKAKLSKVVRSVKIPKGISQRVLLEYLSSKVSDQFLLGILISSFFKDWVNNDKRHKHVVVPDVISEFPIPIPSNIYEHEILENVKYDLKFQTQLKKIEQKRAGRNHAELVFHIEKLTEDIISNNSDPSNQLKINYLNKLVEILYRPVTAASTLKVFQFENVLKSILQNIEEAEESSAS